MDRRRQDRTRSPRKREKGRLGLLSLKSDRLCCCALAYSSRHQLGYAASYVDGSPGYMMLQGLRPPAHETWKREKAASRHEAKLQYAFSDVGLSSSIQWF